MSKETLLFEIGLLELDKEIPEQKVVKVPKTVKGTHRKHQIHKPLELWETGLYERTPEIRKKQAEAMRKYWASDAAKSRRKNSESKPKPKTVHEEGWVDKRTLPHSDELKKKQGEGVRRYFEEHPERRLRQAEYMRNRTVKPWTDEMRIQKSEFMKGKLYWNNGEIERRSETCPGPDFVRGKISGRRRIKK